MAREGYVLHFESEDYYKESKEYHKLKEIMDNIEEIADNLKTSDEVLEYKDEVRKLTLQFEEIVDEQLKLAYAEYRANSKILRENYVEYVMYDCRKFKYKAHDIDNILSKTYHKLFDRENG